MGISVSTTLILDYLPRGHNQSSSAILMVYIFLVLIICYKCKGHVNYVLLKCVVLRLCLLFKLVECLYKRLVIKGLLPKA